MGSLKLIFLRSVGNLQPKKPSKLCVQQTMTIRCQRNYSIWVLLLFTIVKQIQRLNPLKRASIFSDLSSTITVTSYCFGALSQVRAIGHCVVGQECGIVWPGGCGREFQRPKCIFPMPQMVFTGMCGNMSFSLKLYVNCRVFMRAVIFFLSISIRVISLMLLNRLVIHAIGKN